MRYIPHILNVKHAIKNMTMSRDQARDTQLDGWGEYGGGGPQLYQNHSTSISCTLNNVHLHHNSRIPVHLLRLLPQSEPNKRHDDPSWPPNGEGCIGPAAEEYEI